MAIPVECPGCLAVFSVPDDYGGRRGRCPECGNVFRAPQSGAPGAAKLSRWASWDDETQLDAVDAPTAPKKKRKKKSPQPPPPQPPQPPIAAPPAVSPPGVAGSRGASHSPSPPPVRSNPDDLPPVRLPLPFPGQPVDAVRVAPPALRSPADTKPVAVDARELRELHAPAAAKPASDKRSVAAIPPWGNGEQQPLRRPDEEEQPPLFPTIPSAAVGSSGAMPAHTHIGPKRKSPAPVLLLVLMAVGAAAIVTAAGLVIAYSLSGGGERNIVASSPADPPSANGKDNEGDKTNNDNGNLANDNGGSARDEAPPPVLSQDDRDKVWQHVGPYLVRLDVTTPAGAESGFGFVVDTRGYVATNYHLIAQAQSVQATFAPDLDGVAGTQIPCEGIIAIDPAHDLALVKLVPPGDLPLVELALLRDFQPQRDEVLVACAFPSADVPYLAECRARKLATNDEVPATDRAVLRDRRLNDTDDLTWILHRPSFGLEMSGSPLINEKGGVVGISTPLSSTGSDGTAIHVKHLADLLASAGTEVKPFAPDMVAGGDPPDVDPPIDPTNPTPDPPTVPDDPGPSDPRELTVEAIVKLHQQCKAAGWRAADRDQYAVLQELARAITIAKQVEEDETQPEAIRVALGIAAQTVLEDLSSTAWPNDERLAETNKQAADGLAFAGRPLFAYGHVVGPAGTLNPIDEKPAVLFELVGTEQLVILLVTENPSELTNGSRWLLLGNHDSRHRLTLSTNDPTVPPRPAPVIQAKYIVGEPQPEK